MKTIIRYFLPQLEMVITRIDERLITIELESWLFLGKDFHFWLYYRTTILLPIMVHKL